jgi:NAD(P)-dependent dehydrogenase (short-subunit alcohol dehydrogenase family)
MADTRPPPVAREPELHGHTVLVIGGSGGIGLEVGRCARAEGADVIVTGRNPDRLAHAVSDIGARGSVAFDAMDPDALSHFFEGLPEPVDHIMVTAGSPHYGRLADMDLAEMRQALDEHFMLTIDVARHAGSSLKPGGSLTYMGGTGARRPGVGMAIASTVTVGMPALVANLALELAPSRVNLIAPGFVDTPLSASLLGDQLEARREQLRATLPIGRVVGPADVAALAVHLMTNTALTGATFDIDGGQQLLPH